MLELREPLLDGQNDITYLNLFSYLNLATKHYYLTCLDFVCYKYTGNRLTKLILQCHHIYEQQLLQFWLALNNIFHCGYFQ